MVMECRLHQFKIVNAAFHRSLASKIKFTEKIENILTFLVCDRISINGLQHVIKMVKINFIIKTIAGRVTGHTH